MTHRQRRGRSPVVPRSQNSIDEQGANLTLGLEPELEYVQLCHEYGLPVDPAVVITLKSGWAILQPTRNFKDGHLLPLAGILQRCTTQITSIHLPALETAGSGNSNARVLSDVLQGNSNLTNLDLTGTCMTKWGMLQLCEGLAKNTSLKSLSVGSNDIGPEGAQRLLSVICAHPTLEFVNVCNNHLGYHTARALQIGVRATGRPIELNVDGNFVMEEVLNGVTHGLGVMLVCIGGFVLQRAVAGSKEPHGWACAIYWASLLFLYLASTLYHCFFLLGPTKHVFGLLDHCAIFVLIAGTYTPVTMISLEDSWSGFVLLLAEWGLCFLGIALHLYGMHNHFDTSTVELLMYVAMGWAILLVWKDVVNNISEDGIWLLKAGGVAYTAGIGFFKVGEITPMFHVVWHIFVMVGSIMHYILVLQYIVLPRHLANSTQPM